ncbi:DUF3037 domain-containing protein [Clostridium estertheticum]|uniref:DUF3037 domain-containing protein n=1 Tax=Clostridium estertheticum TaxID=238834 RepID=UPI001C7D0B7B|nr:DUF3037 domain-containing protein [Clostridium estertheticum]MBX4271451.1 DUF3037 domain-containing protein [Clostridium estertheticum]WLC81004.1 DUF3037 domain-containing protein [Clostridium estertheticum]
MKVLFSVLSYYPSFITDESINLGILFHNVDEDIRVFETTTNWNRIKHFDDEIDIEMLKDILIGIRTEVSQENLFNYKEKFSMEKYIKFYVNELKFPDITNATTNSFYDFIEETKKMFLRYDYDKAERPDKDEQIRYIKNLLKNNEVEFTTKYIPGEHRENVQYDYIIDEYAFKLFTFEGKKITRLVNSAKAWAYTAKEMETKYKTIFLYDIERNDETFDAIMHILKSSSYKVLKIDQAIEFILKLNDKTKPLIQTKIG